LLLVLSHFVSCVLTPCYCHFFPSFATHALLPYLVALPSRLVVCFFLGTS
jgi:hypothetical protein